MSRVALGVKVFSRDKKLEQLLDSVNGEIISKVYVADDGKQSEKRKQIFNRTYPFELEVLELDYDAGIGYGRRRIAEELTEDYLLMVDSDHEVPSNIGILINQLESLPEFGGISGLLLEDGRIWGNCHDLYEENNLLIRDIRELKHTQSVAGHPLVEFNFLPQITVFRKECLADYAWDPSYTIGKAHLDFYVGHLNQTDWRFGTCPEVLFNHHPGGDETYMSNRGSEKKLLESKMYFFEKWGYRQIIGGPMWVDSYQSQDYDSLGNMIFEQLPLQAQAYWEDIGDIAQKIRTA